MFKVLLISPKTPETFWSFRHALRLISRKSIMPPLGLLTVAAMLPRKWELKLIDLNVRRLDDAAIDWADYVFLSAMIIEADSARQVVARCQARGKTVIAGGPLFTTGHERFPEVRHFVLGEAETIMPTLVQDMSAGRLRHIYQDSDKPDLVLTPIPRWDLINLKHYAMMPAQFSRGCPFNCEFCDIIEMYGRVPRVKTPQQFIAELDAIIDAGWRDAIFIVDDNFIANRARATALLRELIDWRRRRALNTTFLTEASVNLADSPELLDLMGQAGFRRVFIGVETPQEESLAECAKVQNTRRDLVGAIRKIQNAGMEVMGGYIVGFDSDGPGIFERQWRFIQESGVVTAMVGLLTALPKTQLYTRLQKEGRLLGESVGNNLCLDNLQAALNFVPTMNRRALIEGYRVLVKRLYTPREYYERTLRFLSQYRPAAPRVAVSLRDFFAFIRSIWLMGVRSRGRRAYWKYLAQVLLFHRSAFAEAMNLAIRGYHFRKVAERL